MPSDTFLDGELWFVYSIETTLFLIQCYLGRFGRDNFQEAAKISSKADLNTIDWKRFKYMVFDIPNLNAPYEQRYANLGSPSVLSTSSCPIHPLLTSFSFFFLSNQ